MKAPMKLAALAMAVALLSGASTKVEARNLLNSLLGRPGINTSTHGIIQSNFATRQAQLRSQISTAVASGRLSASAAASLIAELDQINAREHTALASGGISQGEANELVAMFGDVTTRLNSLLGSTAINPYDPYGRYGNPYGRSYNRYLNQSRLNDYLRQLGVYPGYFY
jgi:hypothetical protein